MQQPCNSPIRAVVLFSQVYKDGIVADHECPEEERRGHAFLHPKGMVRKEVGVHTTVDRLPVHGLSFHQLQGGANEDNAVLVHMREKDHRPD